MNNLIFLRKYDLINASMNDKNGFMMAEIANEVACVNLGKIYTNDVLYDHDLAEFIPEEVAKHNPKWVIAVGNSATVAQRLKHHRKILVDPVVEFGDLNKISEFDRSYTYGFFDKSHEKDYERFQTVFPNTVWYGDTNNIYLNDIIDIIKAIIKEQLQY